MFHPVGNEPPSVYWRRRLLLAAAVIAVIVLLALTVNAVTGGSGGSGTPAAGTTPSSTAPTTPTAHTTAPSTHASTPASTHASTGSTPTTSGAPSTPGSSSSAPPGPCTATQLLLRTASSTNSYTTSQQPTLMLDVTNKSTTPCVQDLGDSQVVLRVYNGASRVWGSHDCKVEPGTIERTLLTGKTVHVTIVWSGTSSEPNCAGTRQRVGAGTYTLYGSLASHDAAASQFSIK